MSLQFFMDPSHLANLGNITLVLKQIALAFIPVTCVAVSLRVYVRVAVVRGFGLDDLMLLVAQFFFLAFCGIIIRLINLQHDETVIAKFLSGPQGALSALEEIYTDCVLFTMFYCFCIVFLKISLAFFYLRIVIQKWQRALLYVTCTAMTIYGLAYAFIYMFRCGIDTNHQLMAREQNKCLSDQTLLVMMYAFGILDTITDFVYAGIPVYVLWGSNMPIGLKLTAGILLTMGSASCVCALIRVATLSRLTFGPEFFTQAVQTGLWSIIEPGLALVAASIAACKPLWRQISRSRSSKRSGISSSQSQNDKILSRPSGLTFSERTEANRGFTKFDGDDYGISITTVKAGEGGQMMELQDLGGLEAQDDFREEDRSIKSLIRASVGSSEHRGKSKIFQTRDVWVDVKEGRPAHRGVSL